MPTVKEFAIASAVNGCSTSGLRKLDDQIVEILLAAVNTATETHLVRCDDIPLLRVAGNSTIPLLQPAARESLSRVIAQKNKPLDLIHAYRTVAQQFVLRQWKINGKCRITAARNPGTSDHERGIAIDIDSDQLSTFKQALENNQWHWAGDGDPGHFSFIGNGVSPKVITEGVRSFQILWNRNHPEDPIKEDGIFGDIQTGPRLLRSPVEGFEIV